MSTTPLTTNPGATCDSCGGELHDGAALVCGRVWCRECQDGREPPVPMPPTAREKAQIAAWLAPRRAAS